MPRLGSRVRIPSPAPVLPKIAEINQKLSPRRSPPHVVYTKRLHNSAVERGLNPEKSTINCQAGVYTERLHKRPYGLCLKRSVYHYRRRVPADLIKVLGHREIWRTLETDSYILAVRRIFRVAAMVESQFEQARTDLGRSWDSTLAKPFEGSSDRRAPSSAVSQSRSTANVQDMIAARTVGEVYDMFIADPRHTWTDRKSVV